MSTTKKFSVDETDEKTLSMIAKIYIWVIHDNYGTIQYVDNIIHTTIM